MKRPNKGNGKADLPARTAKLAYVYTKCIEFLLNAKSDVQRYGATARVCYSVL